MLSGFLPVSISSCAVWASAGPHHRHSKAAIVLFIIFPPPYGCNWSPIASETTVGPFVFPDEECALSGRAAKRPARPGSHSWCNAALRSQCSARPFDLVAHGRRRRKETLVVARGESAERRRCGSPHLRRAWLRHTETPVPMTSRAQ